MRRRHVMGGVAGAAAVVGLNGRDAAKAAEAGFNKRLFAWTMANGMEAYTSAVQEEKDRAFDSFFTHLRETPASRKASASSPLRVLEVGVGAGANMAAFARSGLPNVDLVGIDPNPYMESYAEAAAEANNIPFQFTLGDVENLPLPDASVDAVVITLVLCSVPDQQRALKEIRRVLKPGGTFFFWEHVHADEKDQLLRFQQSVMSPLQQVVVSLLPLGIHPRHTKNTQNERRE